MCVGLNDLTRRLEVLKEDKMSFKTFRRKLPDFLFEIEEGNGESYIVKYVTDVYMKNDLRNFTGKTRILEYKLDGSYKNIEEMRNDIDINKCYSNNFEGMISINVTSLSDYMNWEQYDYFLKTIREYSQYASLIIFINPKTDKEKLLYKKLALDLGWLECFKVEKYDTKELIEMVVEKLNDMGIDITAEKALSKALIKVFEKMEVKVCRDIEIVIDKIVKYVDFYKYRPEINMTCIEKIKNI